MSSLHCGACAAVIVPLLCDADTMASAAQHRGWSHLPTANNTCIARQSPVNNVLPISQRVRCGQGWCQSHLSRREESQWCSRAAACGRRAAPTPDKVLYRWWPWCQRDLLHREIHAPPRELVRGSGLGTPSGTGCARVASTIERVLCHVWRPADEPEARSAKVHLDRVEPKCAAATVHVKNWRRQRRWPAQWNHEWRAWQWRAEYDILLL